jgi:hypothetical protein
LEDYGECKKLASRPELQRLLANFLRGEESSKGIVNRMREFRDKRQASTGVDSVHDYERYFMIVTDADERMEDIRISQSSLKTQLIAVLTSIDAKRGKA